MKRLLIIPSTILLAAILASVLFLGKTEGVAVAGEYSDSDVRATLHKIARLEAEQLRELREITRSLNALPRTRGDVQPVYRVTPTYEYPRPQ